MNETAQAPEPSPSEPVPPAAAAPASVPAPPRPPTRWKRQHTWVALGALAVLGVASLVLAWQAQQRVQSVEQQLVRRQQDTQGQSAEAHMLSKQAQDVARDAAAKVALLDARVTEVAVQRGQIEDLVQSLSRSRDENLIVDIESAIRVALQQAALTGSAEPLVATLKQSDERLARYNQPRLEGVRRAIARDLDRVKAVGLVDIATLTIKLDEVIRLVDELPLLSRAEVRDDTARAAPVAPGNKHEVPTATADMPDWLRPWAERWQAVSQRIWGEAKSLVRVTRIDHPEAMLLVPEQAFFLRENLKLRLLNARLALLSRQFETAQSDLQVAQNSINRYFDRSSRRTMLALDMIKQVAVQARQVGVPRPDDTLAALSTAAAGR